MPIVVLLIHQFLNLGGLGAAGQFAWQSLALPECPKLCLYVTDGNYPYRQQGLREFHQAFCHRQKNWLFSDTVASANASANLYCLLQTCAANGVDRYRYLRALLGALLKAQTVDDYEALLPWNIVLPAG